MFIRHPALWNGSSAAMASVCSGESTRMMAIPSTRPVAASRSRSSGQVSPHNGRGDNSAVHRRGQKQVIELAPQLFRCGCEAVEFGDQLSCQCTHFCVGLLQSPPPKVESLLIADAIDEPKHSLGLLDDRARLNDLRQGLVEDLSSVHLQGLGDVDVLTRGPDHGTALINHPVDHHDHTIDAANLIA